MSRSYPRKQHKFYTLFLSLDENERKEFEQFAKISFITGGRNYSDILMNKDSTGKHLSSRSYWNRLSELTRIIEDYLLLKYMHSDIEERNVKLLEVLTNRNLSDAIEPQFNRTIKLMKSQKHGIMTLYNLHRLHFAYSGHEMQNNRYLEYVKHFRKQSEYVISHFLIYIFGSQIEFNQQKLENIWHDYLANEIVLRNLNVDKIISSFKENLPDVYLNVKYVYYLYKAFDQPDKPEYFFEARKTFCSLLPALGREYTSLSYQAQINYCIDRTNNYDESFNRVLFEIYNEKLSKGFDDDIRQKNYPTNNFRDYVIVGLRLKEYEWVEKFIIKYGELLPDEYKPDEIKITKAMLYLARNEFDRALKSLEKTRRRNYLHYTDISEMKLRIFYETGDFANANDELTRLDKYLKTNESIPGERKINYDNFRKAYKLLLNLREHFKKERLDKLQKFLAKSPNFRRRAWIVEKVNELGR